MGRHDTLPDLFFWSHTHHLEELGHYRGNYLKFWQESNINQSKHISSGYYVCSLVAPYERPRVPARLRCIVFFDVGQNRANRKTGQYRSVPASTANLAQFAH
jgi:hypothetical protein